MDYHHISSSTTPSSIYNLQNPTASLIISWLIFHNSKYLVTLFFPQYNLFLRETLRNKLVSIITLVQIKLYQSIYSNTVVSEMENYLYFVFRIFSCQNSGNTINLISSLFGKWLYSSHKLFNVFEKMWWFFEVLALLHCKT